MEEEREGREEREEREEREGREERERGVQCTRHPADNLSSPTMLSLYYASSM